MEGVCPGLLPWLDRGRAQQVMYQGWLYTSWPFRTPGQERILEEERLGRGRSQGSCSDSDQNSHVLLARCVVIGKLLAFPRPWLPLW